MLTHLNKKCKTQDCLFNQYKNITHYLFILMSYVGTKVFFGVCLNMYVTILLINNQNVWLNKRLIEERGLIIAGLKSGDAKNK